MSGCEKEKIQFLLKNNYNLLIKGGNAYRQTTPIFICTIRYDTLTNSVDPDEMPQIVASHLGLHCLLR